MTVGLLGAKAYSRRVPGKALREFHGHPLFTWTVRQMVCSHSIDRVIVSTDDEAIATVARQYGAEAFMRKDAMSLHPDASWHYPMHEVMKSLDLGDDDIMHSSLLTSPVRCPWDFDKMTALIEGGADYAIPICPFHDICLYDTRAKSALLPVVMDKSGRYGVLGGGTAVWRVSKYWDTATAMSVAYDDWLDSTIDQAAGATDGRVYPSADYIFPKGGVQKFYAMKPWQQWDIDDEDTWQMAELAFERYILGAVGESCYEDYRDGEPVERRKASRDAL